RSSREPSEVVTPMARPPIRSADSRTITSIPRRCSSRAVTRPESPAPTTITVASSAAGSAWSWSMEAPFGGGGQLHAGHRAGQPSIYHLLVRPDVRPIATPTPAAPIDCAAHPTEGATTVSVARPDGRTLRYQHRRAELLEAVLGY